MKNTLFSKCHSKMLLSFSPLCIHLVTLIHGNIWYISTIYSFKRRIKWTNNETEITSYVMIQGEEYSSPPVIFPLRIHYLSLTIASLHTTSDWGTVYKITGLWSSSVKVMNSRKDQGIVLYPNMGCDPKLAPLTAKDAIGTN